LLDIKMTFGGDMDCSGLGIQLVDGRARVEQQVRTKLRIMLGEWEFDLDEGVDWFGRILGIKGINLTDVESLIREAILAVADVRTITAFSMAFDRETRNLSINAKINTTFGVTQVEGMFP
jgi:hypothetical protein